MISVGLCVEDVFSCQMPSFMLYRMNVLHCKNHPDAPLIEDYHAGDMICSLCGLVVGDRVIDVGSEWRTFSNDKNSKDMSRVGAAEVCV